MRFGFRLSGLPGEDISFSELDLGTDLLAECLKFVEVSKLADGGMGDIVLNEEVAMVNISSFEALVELAEPIALSYLIIELTNTSSKI